MTDWYRVPMAEGESFMERIEGMDYVPVSFRVIEDEWEQDADGLEWRTIHHVEVIDARPVGVQPP